MVKPGHAAKLCSRNPVIPSSKSNNLQRHEQSSIDRTVFAKEHDLYSIFKVSFLDELLAFQI